MIEVGAELRVKDCGSNRASPFWEPLIGKKAMIVALCDDGFWDVTIVGVHPLVPGVVPSRFDILSETPPKSLAVSAWNRLAPTLYVLAIILVLLLIIFILPDLMRAHG
jgi:hypothetical protein